MQLNPIYLKDVYKTGHGQMMPEGTELIYSNLTARKSRMEGVDEMVFFGLQYFILKYLIEDWQNNFFMQNGRRICSDYEGFLNSTLGQNYIGSKHIKELHQLAYLPIRIRAVKEGQLVPMRVPCLTIENTLPEFYWLTNFFETALSAVLWGAITTATAAFQFKRQLNYYRKLTVSDIDDGVGDYLIHNFSMRGCYGIEAAMISGAAHLLSSVGTDTIPAIPFLQKYYDADVSKEVVGVSCSASEHSVMSLGTAVEGEFELYKRLITKVQPNGMISLVSDTYDFYNVVTNYLPRLKSEILARDGKLVIRADSSLKTPVEVICGDPDSPVGSPEYKGLVECLWDIFGGTYTEKGYKLLDSHIGAIYGDSITLGYQYQILQRLMEKGFACYNIALGTGSFSLVYFSRDSLGLAIKATAAIVKGREVAIYKDPITDDGTKKSARGFLKVVQGSSGKLVLLEDLTRNEAEGGLLEDVFVDGRLTRRQSLSDIRKIIKDNLLVE